MKENIIKKTIEEVNGYVADDGTWFLSKEECLKYETTAKVVLFNRVKSNMITKITPYSLFGEGNDDSNIEIYKINNLETVELLNRYIKAYRYKEYNKNLVTDDMVGKDILISWNYDHDWCEVLGTINDIIERIKKAYIEALAQE